ncbi:MAG: metal ABC transporter ATP-binding protein [Eubacteriales bacterium]
MGDKLIECVGVSVAYEHITALDGATFDIESGDSISVVGENGSGKSTLLSCILGLRVPDKGEVRYYGINRREIGYLPQSSAVSDDFPASVNEVVLSGTLNRRDGFSFGFYTSADRRCAEENLALLGISGLKRKSYRNLSGGQRQRVLLARALCASRRLLILDEPATGLDPVVTDEFYGLIERLHKGGLTVLTVSHDIGYAMRYSTKILHLGTAVKFFGTTDEYRKTELYRRMSGEGCGEEERS